MGTLAGDLKQDALQLGSSFKRQELQLQQEKQRLELQIADAQASADAAHIAAERSLQFEPLIDGDAQCPRCWVSGGLSSHLYPIPVEGPDDYFRCQCGYEICLPSGGR